MIRPRATLLVACLLATVSFYASAQTVISSSIDWSTGVYRVLASRPLEEGQSPDDHPRAMEALERELGGLLVDELGELAWDNRGSLGDLMRRYPAVRDEIDQMASSFQKEWSRLSEDYTRVEAAYVLNIAEQVSTISTGGSLFEPPSVPAGWRAVPEDDWTGIAIYVPDGLPVRGTGLNADIGPALRARILSDNLDVLSDPSMGGSPPAYFLLDERGSAEQIIGRRPYRTLARGLYGDVPCDIILSAEATTDILASESGRRALSEGRVVILVDRMAN